MGRRSEQRVGTADGMLRGSVVTFSEGTTAVTASPRTLDRQVPIVHALLGSRGFRAEPVDASDRGARRMRRGPGRQSPKRRPKVVLGTVAY